MSEFYRKIAQNSAEEQNAAVEKVLKKGCAANLIRFTEGTVLNGRGGMEHMASFDYAYRLDAVRSWLFRQTTHSPNQSSL